MGGKSFSPSALGKRIWFFVGHPEADWKFAVLYSILGTCQRHGHNPHNYLRDVLSRLPAMTTDDDFGPLPPSQWKPRTATTS